MAITLSGSLILSGSIEATGGVTISGSIASASYAENASTASYVVNSLTASYVVTSLTASFVANAVSSSYSLNALTSSNAMTASSADTLYVRNNVTALGSITAQTLIVQTITSSVLFTTGSNKIGSSLSNTQELTGSVGITGSLSVNTNGTEFQVSAGGVNIGNALTDNHIISGSVTINPNGLFVSSSGNVGINNVSPTVALDVTGAGKFSGVLTLGSTISNGTYTYTLPSATGTLALTSALSGTTNYVAKFTSSTGIGNSQIFDNATNVGINTATPTAKLEIYDNSNSGILRLSRDAGGQRGALEFGRNNGGSFQTCGSIIVDSDIASVNSGLMYFYTSNSSGTNTERMRITSAGNVGIGTTSPSNILHVAQSNTGNIGIAIQNTNASYAAQVRFLNAAGSEKAAVTYVQSASALRFNNNTYDAIEITSGGGVDLYNPTTIGKNTNAGSCIGFTENQIYRTGNGVLYLQEYSTNHIIALNGGGNFLIGTSTNLGYRLFANGTAAGLSNWNNVSDGRLKKDITPVLNGLDKIKQLNGVYFNWDKTLRPDLNLDGNNHLGLIAQDVEAILPQVVTTGDDEFNTKTIAYSDIVPVLIEAIKELSTKNTSLEERLAILENAQ